MSKITKIVLTAFAAYRISRLITREDGPNYIFGEIREKAVKHAATSNSSWASSLADGLHCPHCIGVWVAALLLILPDWVSVIFGIAGIQSAIDTYLWKTSDK